MNSMTNLNRALNLAMQGDADAPSKFRVVNRSYDERRNRHEVTIRYVWQDKNYLPITPSKGKQDPRRERLFKQIMDATKIRAGK